MDKTLGKKIMDARIKSGLSQNDIAEMLSISNQAVSKWENGLSKPSAENLIRLFEILGLSGSEIRTESDGIYTGGKSMKSIRDIYKIGRGPSSSHTIGPEKACIRFRSENKDADEYRVVLYGSLAKAGAAVGTDAIITKTLFPAKVSVIFDKITITPHPNTMDLTAYKNKKALNTVRVISTGGGDIIYGDEKSAPSVYSMQTFSEIANYCKEHDIALWQYVKRTEGEGLWDYLKNIWDTMKRTISAGLCDEGVLPGGLGVRKKARQLFESGPDGEAAETRESRLICAYAFATSEQNASGEVVVTGPTCGSAGVLPAVLYYEQQKHGFSDEQIIRALATAGLIGNLIKTNASVSGAECGCQAEIGSACSMAAGALGQLMDLSIDKIEYSAEIALEHHLGLTCDLICGLVQIPCIERNAVAAMRAINAVCLANLLWDTRKISFDNIVRTMKETGRDMPGTYKETLGGGLAKVFTDNN